MGSVPPAFWHQQGNFGFSAKGALGRIEGLVPRTIDVLGERRPSCSSGKADQKSALGCAGILAELDRDDAGGRHMPIIAMTGNVMQGIGRRPSRPG